MYKEDYLAWLESWFAERVKMPSDAASCNFFTEGWLDSFRTLELIMAIESAFKLSLDDALFSDPRFSTINGLSDILFERKTATNQ